MARATATETFNFYRVKRPFLIFKFHLDCAIIYNSFFFQWSHLIVLHFSINPSSINVPWLACKCYLLDSEPPLCAM